MIHRDPEPWIPGRRRVSVVIPAYNAAATIGTTLDSVFAQTYGDFEVVVVDDGSTDTTRAVLAGYGPRLNILQKSNEGRPATARNLGVRASGGEYIAFLDADDCWTADKLALQVAMMDRDAGVGLVYTADLTIDAEGHALSVNPCIHSARGRIYDLLRVRNVMVGSSVMVRRAAFDSAGGFDESLTSVENWDLWIRIAKDWTVEYIDQPLTLYRVHPLNRSGSITLRQANVFAVLAKHHSETDRSVEGRRLRRDAYFHVHFDILGRAYFGQHDMKRARTALLRAALLKPRPDVLRLLLLSLLGARGFSVVRALKRRVAGRARAT